MDTYTWNDLMSMARPPARPGEVMCIDLGNGRGLYVQVQERLDDHDDPRICGRCHMRISYAHAGVNIITKEVVHVMFDCTKD